MTRRCTVCVHDERDAIDASIVNGAPYRRIATQYQLAEASVRRHVAAHLPEALVLAAEASTAARADQLLEQATGLLTAALDLLEQARQAGDLRAALSAIGQARGVLELLARLKGELPDTTMNITVSAEWIQVRSVVLSALTPWPDA